MQWRQGKVILLGGGGATAPLPNFSSYAASKAAVVRLADTLAEELKPLNVQVNVMAPGLVDTRLQDEVLAAGDRAGPLLDKIKKARETGAGAVSPDVAASLAVFLASPASGKLTGKLIAAPYDPWREWAGKADELNATPLYTLRRLDPFTIKPLIKVLT
jgi:NAD(P)-dependent dehydrogenase (short-subunit alcohol dehydrogenase family)